MNKICVKIDISYKNIKFNYFLTSSSQYLNIILTIKRSGMKSFGRSLGVKYGITNSKVSVFCSEGLNF